MSSRSETETNSTFRGVSEDRPAGEAMPSPLPQALGFQWTFPGISWELSFYTAEQAGMLG